MIQLATTAEEKIVVTTPDHFQRIEVNFGDGGRISIEMMSFGETNLVIARPKPGQNITMNVHDEAALIITPGTA